MYSLLPLLCAVIIGLRLCRARVVLAASIDLHIDSGDNFLCNAIREHLMKLSICSLQLWFWRKDTK
jgi:hypothetical protein